ncbi:MAG: putative metal-dependent hydrolase [Cyclobacteriaceae bacterium]
MSTDQHLRYPIGEFLVPDNITAEHIANWISEIATFPQRLKDMLVSITSEQQGWKYRTGSWTITQLVHHCADSHLNSLMRFKLAITEDRPKIKPYDEVAWAELADDLETDLGYALLLLEGLHHKWVVLLNSLAPKDLERTFAHPEHGTIFTLKETIGSYAWHCNHHLAHIKLALDSQGRYS